MSGTDIRMQVMWNRLRVVAPEDSSVNANPPRAFRAGNIVDHMPDVLGGMHPIVPRRVPAEGCSALWSVKPGAGHWIGKRWGVAGAPTPALRKLVTLNEIALSSREAPESRTEALRGRAPSQRDERRR